MVRVTGPMFGLDARGQLGKAIVFTIRRGTNVVRSYVKQKTSQTTDQVTVRSVFADGMSSWRHGLIESPDKTLWINYAEGTSETGLNRFMRFYLGDNYDSATKEKEEPPIIPDPQ